MELKGSPLSYWLPAYYENENELAHGPDYQRVTSKLFAFSITLLFIYANKYTNFETCRFVMTY